MPTRILLIDDEEPVRQVLRRMLEQAGYAVVEASNGREGLALLRQQEVALVITDILMPERDGLEITMIVRRTWPHIRVIAMTGASLDFDYLDTAQMLGARRVLRKPITYDELVRAVREELAS